MDINYRRSLDAYITGRSDPNAPFNRDDDVWVCQGCGFVGHETELNWDENEKEYYCPDCNKIVYTNLRNG